MRKLFPLRRLILFVTLTAALFPFGCNEVDSSTENDGGVLKAPALRNVIVMISDGMGYNHIELTNFYQHGEKGKQIFESFPVIVPMYTGSTETGDYDPERAWTDFSYQTENPTDSAAAATAMATGVRSYNRSIGFGPDSEPRPSVLDRAGEMGKSTGVITNTYFADATPACFGTHTEGRSYLYWIVTQMLYESSIDVIMGAGHPLYNDDGNPEVRPGKYLIVGGKRNWERIMSDLTGADADGDGKPDEWTMIQTKEEFQDLVTGETSKRVFGLVQAYKATQSLRTGVDDNYKDDLPYQTPRNEKMPTLREMALGAINVLDDNPNGFFVMIESEGVDEMAHKHSAGRVIEEVIEFSDTVEAIIEWVEENSSWEETLLIVSGDHETGFLTGPNSNPEITPLVNNGKGQMPGYAWNTRGHSNLLIPVFAKGKFAEKLLDYADQADPKHGNYINNYELGQFLKQVIVEQD